MITLVTAANAPYMPRIAPYLHTIQEHSRFDRNVLVTVGCRVEMPTELAGIQAIGLPVSEARGHTGNFCIQQGCFLDVLGAADDDVIVFTDGDITLQRPPSADELAWIGAIPDNTIALAWNAGPDDTLADEGTRIGLTLEGRRMFAAVLHRKVWNVGVIICRKATYAAIYERYMALWPAFYPLTAHYAANQFLMCAVIAELGIGVWEAPASLHTHGCFGIPGWATEQDGIVSVGGIPVLFNHHF